MEAELATFPRLLLEHAHVRGERPATREKDLGIWQTWTWAQVADEVRALACGLAALGFKRGMRLAIIGDNRPRLYWSMTAAQALGGIAVPMYQDAPAAEFAYVLNDAEITRRVAVFDRTLGCAAFDSRSTASWLRSQARLSPAAASEQVRVARQLLEAHRQLLHAPVVAARFSQHLPVLGRVEGDNGVAVAHGLDESGMGAPHSGALDVDGRV